MQYVVVLLVAMAAWQVEMAVQCAHRCVHRPRTVRVEKPRDTQPVPQPQCRGPQCQTPSPVPASHSLRR
jgi:hypothetical protein